MDFVRAKLMLHKLYIAVRCLKVFDRRNSDIRPARCFCKNHFRELVTIKIRDPLPICYINTYTNINSYT